MSQTRTPLYDVILYGATGFTGRQTAQYFARTVGSSLRWAIAGRSLDKLNSIKASLGQEGASAGIVVADSSQPESVAQMVSQTRVLLTTAGPFALYGEPVIAACARAGVDYVDITGETPFVRKMIDLYEADAIKSGAKIIPFCGFDSVPSDLGSFLMVDYLRTKHQQKTRSIKAFFLAKGGFNGGTLASALNMGESAQWDLLNDPVLLNPPKYQTAILREQNPDVTRAHFDPDLQAWAAPFFMGPVNTRVVRRSQALYTEAGEGYGDAFAYQEYLWVKTPAPAMVARMIAGGSSIFEGILGTGLGRSVLKALAPAPGEGPSEATMDNGFFSCTLFGQGEPNSPSDTAVSVRSDWFDKGDPGNRVTVKLLCESALALALQRSALPGGDARVGFLTPATAFGHVLADRLRAAGMKITVEDRRP